MTAANTITVDPVTASVIQGALENIAVEMGYKLMRMSYSSIIRESEDFGAALVDAEGRGLAESAQSTPLQSGPIPGYIRGILKALRERRDAVRPGDVIMHNDAYGGASHGPDVGFAVPVFHDGRLVAFAATTAHHLDIGAPGLGQLRHCRRRRCLGRRPPIQSHQGVRPRRPQRRCMAAAA